MEQHTLRHYLFIFHGVFQRRVNPSGKMLNDIMSFSVCTKTSGTGGILHVAQVPQRRGFFPMDPAPPHTSQLDLLIRLEFIRVTHI